MNAFDKYHAQVVPGGREDIPAPSPVTQNRSAFDRYHSDPTTTLRSVQDVSPDHVSRARRAGVPEAVSPEFLAEREREQALANTPRTREWLTNPANAAVAHDTVEELGTLENLARGAGESALDLVAGTLETLGIPFVPRETEAEWARRLRDTNLGYTPQTTIDDVLV
jgi:hypothetical protein